MNCLQAPLVVSGATRAQLKALKGKHLQPSEALGG